MSYYATTADAIPRRSCHGRYCLSNVSITNARYVCIYKRRISRTRQTYARGDSEDETNTVTAAADVYTADVQQ